jgi:hypothetical protein
VVTDTERSVISNLTLVVIDHGNIEVRATGVYRDMFVKIADEWRIRERMLKLNLH